MQVNIRHSPSFAVARCILSPNESIKVQPGAMMAHSNGIEIQAKMDGGLFAGLSRAVAGETFTVSTFTAPAQGGWVDLVPETVGDLFAIDVDPNAGFVITSGAWIGNDGNITLKADANARSMFSGEGLIIMKAQGSGQLIGHAYGAIDMHSLAPGEGFTVDTGHLVAWENTVQLRPRRAARGIINSFRSGEGIVVDVVGPGDVITQTRVTPSPSSSR